MSETNRNREQSEVFKRGIREGRREESLGRVETVQNWLLIQQFDFIEAIWEHDEDVTAVTDRISSGMAKVLLGEDDSFEVVEKWNRPESIAVFCKQQLNALEDDPHKIMKHAAASFFDELTDVIVSTTENDLTEAEYVAAIHYLTLRWARFFLGMSFDTQDTILAERPQEQTAK
jgi:hypothetical protein